MRLVGQNVCFRPKPDIHLIGSAMRARHALGAVAIGILGLVVGYAMGFRSAWPMGVQAESVMRGVLAIQVLQAMRSGKTEVATALFEGDVDAALLMGGNFLENPAARLLPAMGADGPGEYMQHMSQVANYRKSNPRKYSSEPRLNVVIDERVQRYAK